PLKSIPSSCALIPIVVVMHVPRAVATRSVGESSSPLPLLSVGASVEIFDCDGPCVASQCKSPVYLIETSTMPKYATRLASAQSKQLRYGKESRGKRSKAGSAAQSAHSSGRLRHSCAHHRQMPRARGGEHPRISFRLCAR